MREGFSLNSAPTTMFSQPHPHLPLLALQLIDSTINASAKNSHLGVPEDVGGAHRGKAEVGVRGAGRACPQRGCPLTGPADIVLAPPQ